MKILIDFRNNVDGHICSSFTSKSFILKFQYSLLPAIFPIYDLNLHSNIGSLLSTSLTKALLVSPCPAEDLKLENTE